MHAAAHYKVAATVPRYRVRHELLMAYIVSAVYSYFFSASKLHNEGLRCHFMILHDLHDTSSMFKIRQQAAQ